MPPFGHHDDSPSHARITRLEEDAVHKVMERGAASVFDPASGVEWPALLLKGSALSHNADLMAKYCDDHGVSLAPHGKTAVSPELWELQKAAGAWAVAVATPQQARIFQASGAQRILLANQLVQPGFARSIQQQLAEDSEFTFLCHVDSVAGVDLLDAELDPEGPPLQVLIEIGHLGGRAGCRGQAAVDAVAAAVARSRPLALVGVAGYEGTVSHARDDAALDEVADYLREVRGHFERIASDGLLHEGAAEYILSAGGSIYFDMAAEILTQVRDLDRPVRVVLRSGAYLTHDNGLYERLSPLAASAGDGFVPAAEVWAQVLSVPERGLVILNAGRRDVPYDQDLPVPLGIRRGDTYTHLEEAAIFELNDHHAFMSTRAGEEPSVGDLVRLGVSHPCTLHDKWRVALIVDDHYRTTSIAHSYF